MPQPNHLSQLWSLPWQKIQEHPFYQQSTHWFQGVNRSVKHRLSTPLQGLFHPSTEAGKSLPFKLMLLPSQWLNPSSHQASAGDSGLVGGKLPANRRNHMRGQSKLVSVDTIQTTPQQTMHMMHGDDGSTHKLATVTLGDWFIRVVDVFGLDTSVPRYTFSSAGLDPEWLEVRAWLTLRDAHKVPAHWKPTPQGLHTPLTRLEVLTWYYHMQNLVPLPQNHVYYDGDDAELLWQAPQADPLATLNHVVDWAMYTPNQQQLALLAYRHGLLARVFALPITTQAEAQQTTLKLNQRCTPQEATHLMQELLPLSQRQGVDAFNNTSSI